MLGKSCKNAKVQKFAWKCPTLCKSPQSKVEQSVQTWAKVCTIEPKCPNLCKKCSKMMESVQSWVIMWKYAKLCKSVAKVEKVWQKLRKCGKSWEVW